MAVAAVLRDVHQVAPTNATVLILGETGVGKELLARAIHSASPRHDRPLIKVNCAAIPANLIESEFFGHEKGAFTGATKKREGRFSLADGSTIFLDEVGELPLDLQVKLLRVLQEGEFEPVGSSQTRRVDLGVIAATEARALWWESFGRVAAEALINGIPVLGSTRGSLPETLEQAGFLFDVPERYTPDTRLVPSAEEVAPWVETIIRLWEDDISYEQERRRCLAAEAWRPERLLARFEDFFDRVLSSPSGTDCSAARPIGTTQRFGSCS